MACSEMDIDADWSKIEPFIPFLDKCWLLPMCLSVDKTPTSMSLMNITLSYRGAERQAPSVLSLALRFSSIMSAKSAEGLHDKGMNTEQRLRAVVEELHSSEGFLSRWHLDNDKFRAINNILVGTSPEARTLIQSHLNVHKWQFCSFTAELLRSCRWLIGASPSKAGSNLKPILTMTHESQIWFLENHIRTFVHDTRRVKQGSRAKCRPSVEAWDRAADYACIMSEVYKQAKELYAEDAKKSEAVCTQIRDSFLARLETANIQTSCPDTEWF